MTTEKAHIIKIRKKIIRSVRKLNLISDKDRIIVAVSGGKDSMILLETLAYYRKHAPFSYELHAVHVKLSGLTYKTSKKELTTFCNALDVPLHYREVAFEWDKTKKDSVCFACSWRRREVLFNMIRELKCNKVAFGHHLDDAVETLLLNMIFHGSMSSLPETISMFDGEFSIIRPLLHITKKELAEYASYKDFKTEKKVCKYSKATKRHEVGKLLDILETWTKEPRRNIFKAMSNRYPEYLPTGVSSQKKK